VKTCDGRSGFCGVRVSPSDGFKSPRKPAVFSTLNLSSKPKKCILNFQPSNPKVYVSCSKTLLGHGFPMQGHNRQGCDHSMLHFVGKGSWCASFLSAHSATLEASDHCRIFASDPLNPIFSGASRFPIFGAAVVAVESATVVCGPGEIFLYVRACAFVRRWRCTGINRFLHRRRKR
jgi:hypothetical protein